MNEYYMLLELDPPPVVGSSLIVLSGPFSSYEDAYERIDASRKLATAKGHSGAKRGIVTVQALAETELPGRVLFSPEDVSTVFEARRKIPAKRNRKSPALADYFVKKSKEQKEEVLDVARV
jgi:hypothetical protein